MGSAPNAPDIEDMTAKLVQLPSEILLEILLYFPVQRGYCPNEKADALRRASNIKSIGILYNIALTCSRLNEVATPLLYSSLVGIGGRNNWPKLIRYLQTLMEKPGLMKYLRYIETEMSIRRGAEPLSEELIRTFEQMEQHEYWATPMSKLTKPNTKGFTRKELLYVSYLVSLAYNLQSFGIHSYWRDVFCLSPRDNLRLQELSYTRNGDVVTFHSPANPKSEYNPILMLFHRRRSTGSASRWPGVSSGIDETLPIMIDEMNCEGDWRIWRTCEFPYECESIRHFRCRWIGAEPLDLYTIREYLAYTKDTLESLELDNLESERLNSSPSNIPRFESLREFTALKYLRIAGRVLWLPDERPDQPVFSLLFPASLETLVIETKWEDYLRDSLYALAKGCSTHLPHLKRIDCSWGPAPEIVGRQLMTTFEELGVILNMDLVDTLEEKENRDQERAAQAGPEDLTQSKQTNTTQSERDNDTQSEQNNSSRPEHDHLTQSEKNDVLQIDQDHTAEVDQDDARQPGEDKLDSKKAIPLETEDGALASHK